MKVDRKRQQHNYKTVYRQAQAEFVEKRSRFIATVKPVTTEEAAIHFIDEMKSKYWDATRNVYAYVIGNDNIQRYSDDGEPAGTAGIPTLEVIKKEQLQDVVVVVTRYFGGTLLGAGGLVRAYGKSAKEGLIAAGIISMQLCDCIQLKSDYTLLGKIQHEISNSGHIIDEIIYQEDVAINVLVLTEQSDQFIKNMVDITNGRVNIQKKHTKYIAVDEEGKQLTLEADI